MAWTTPTTFTTGNVLTAAQLNTNLRDNTNFLFDPPACIATRASNQSIPNAAGTLVSFTTADIVDTDTMHSTSTNPQNITFNTAGLYLVTINVEFDTNATGSRRVWVADNLGSNFLICAVSNSAIGGSDQVQLCATGLYAAAAASAAVARVYQNSGGALNLLGTSSAADTITQPASAYSATWIGNGV